MSISFRTKLLASHVGLVAAIVTLLVLLLDRSLGADLERRLDQRLEQQASGAAQWGVGERRHPEKIAARLAAVVGAEVTLFDREGKVLGDSRGAQKREAEVAPEVRAALEGNIGHATRPAGESMQEMHYVAVGASDGWVVRLAAPLSDINETLATTRHQLLAAAIVAAVAALGLGVLASRVAAGPLRAMTAAAERIAGGDFDVEVKSSAPDEFGVLARSLSSLAAQLKAHIGELTAERTQVAQLLTVGREFMADASHELRTPVMAIQGYSETLIEGGADSSTARQFLETIHRHACRLGRLVEDMLRLSSLEVRPSADAIFERVDVGGVASAVVDTLQARAEAQGVALRVDVEGRVEMSGDPSALEQVLENLVDNAIKYGRTGGTVAIRGHEDRDEVLVEVEDDGPGIDTHHLPRLFDRFYRVDPERSREKGGAGLGLAIAKQFVESMRGRIRVESELGKGAKFIMRFPRVP
ncbi:HAMP domain-containing histidine kinase [Pendulispora rubella]|uniref:histidine kinase n=1 Tax=Pendulispora rubella TaxID=2741070 RepID=A0ABZ2LDH2_9BACT